MMERLRALRQAHNYTQQQLAKMLKTTQQTIARWETGKVEPNLSALRDLAMIFGTSVDEILGKNPFSDKVTSNWLHLFGKDAVADGFWGHLGLLIHGQPQTKWYPITLSTTDSISGFLADMDENNGREGREWMSIHTLNNKAICVNPNNVRRIWLLDDACDAPADWSDDIREDYSGLSLEFYRGLASYFVYDDELKENASVAFRQSIEEYVKERNLDEETAIRLLHHTSIYMLDGTCASYWAEPEQIYNIIFNAELGNLPKMVRVDAYGGDFESYYPRSNLALIEMPLIDVLDVARKADAELSIDEEDEQDEAGAGQ